jgi:hypothetical protein
MYRHTYWQLLQVSILAPAVFINVVPFNPATETVYYLFNHVKCLIKPPDLTFFILSILSILFRPFGFIAPKTLSYLAFQSFDFARTGRRLFQKRVVRTKFDIYVFINSGTFY